MDPVQQGMGRLQQVPSCGANRLLRKARREGSTLTLETHPRETPLPHSCPESSEASKAVGFGSVFPWMAMKYQTGLSAGNSKRDSELRAHCFAQWCRAAGGTGCTARNGPSPAVLRSLWHPSLPLVTQARNYSWFYV